MMNSWNQRNCICGRMLDGEGMGKAGHFLGKCEDESMVQDADWGHGLVSSMGPYTQSRVNCVVGVEARDGETMSMIDQVKTRTQKENEIGWQWEGDLVDGSTRNGGCSHARDFCCKCY
jgi:hypothetical protein